MKLTADTNVIVRAAMMDDPVHSPRAARLLIEADTIVVTGIALCEFAWVLSSVYRQKADVTAAAIRRLLDTEKVQTDRAAAETGLAVLEAGGDFADGMIAHLGAAAGGEVFASFDRRALLCMSQAGCPILDLNEDMSP